MQAKPPVWVQSLEGAIDAWRREVGGAHAALSGRIDTLSANLAKLDERVRWRANLEAELAAACEEARALREAIEHADVPAGALTQYTVSAPTQAEQQRADFLRTTDALHRAVKGWRAEAARAQAALAQQVALANDQFAALLDALLGTPEAPRRDPASKLAEMLGQSRAEAESLRRENASLAQRAQTLQSDAAQLQAELEREASARWAAAGEAERNAADHKGDAGLTAELAALREEITARDALEAALRDEIERLRDAASAPQTDGAHDDDLADRLESAEARCAALAAENQALSEEAAGLREQGAAGGARGRDTGALRESLDAMERRLADLKTREKASVSAIRDTLAAFEPLMGAPEGDASTRVAELEAEVAELREVLARARSLEAWLQGRNEALEAELQKRDAAHGSAD